MSNYHADVWRHALREAELDVMRATATPTGGRRKNESIEDYVVRTRMIQDAAMLRWHTARDELEKAR